MRASPPERDLRIRRARLVAMAAVVALVAGGTTVAWTIGQAVGGPPESPPAAADTASGIAENGDDEASVAGAALAALSPAVRAQLIYARAHWDETTSERFGFLDENDCVNFASQSLLARGWTTDDEWWYDESGDPYSHAEAWISSTEFMWYLEDHPELATPLTDDQRSSVKVGDIVQFDWDDSGDRDHTGVVTAVETGDDGQVRIGYAGHTDATWDRSVDWAITEYHPGGVAYYWSIPE